MSRIGEPSVNTTGGGKGETAIEPDLVEKERKQKAHPGLRGKQKKGQIRYFLRIKGCGGKTDTSQPWKLL